MGAQDLCIGTISRRITRSTARHTKINGGRAQLSPRSFFTRDHFPSALMRASSPSPNCCSANAVGRQPAARCCNRFAHSANRFVIAVPTLLCASSLNHAQLHLGAA